MSEIRQVSKGASGVRKWTLQEKLPDCEVRINKHAYEFSEILKPGMKFLDVGCGLGRFQKIVEPYGVIWTGVEAFEGGPAQIIGSAEDIPVPDDSYDIVFMNAVLEHVPDVKLAFFEAHRVLKKGGKFIGYVAFMEAFHEISFSHLSFKAVEHYSNLAGLKLKIITGGGAFGVDYHMNIIFNPLPVLWLRTPVAFLIRSILKIKSKAFLLGMMLAKKKTYESAKQESSLFYKLECLSMSNGFNFVIEKE
jgi:SAM-dependent methyltransferase